MKVAGVIVEYNPFHNGHLYHLKKTRELIGADAVIALMSGDFVQRGTPAFLSKYHRTSMALEAGADLVIQLPLPYATGSAEYFAEGAVALLNALGCVDVLSFGSEAGDIDSLSFLAQILAEEPLPYRNFLSARLKEGNSFPKARKLALEDYLGEEKHLASLLDTPNNILGIEYLKALFRSKSSILPLTLPRVGAGYHSREAVDNFPSSTSIRLQLSRKEVPDFTDLSCQVPPQVLRCLKTQYKQQYPVTFDDFSLPLRYRLLQETEESLCLFRDITGDLARRILNHLDDYETPESFCTLLHSKDMTLGRIRRCLLSILLGIEGKEADAIKTAPPYARILGVRQGFESLFSLLSKSSSIPVLIRLSQAESLPEVGKRWLEKEIFATHLFESVVQQKYGASYVSEYKRPLLRL